MNKNKKPTRTLTLIGLTVLATVVVRGAAAEVSRVSLNGTVADTIKAQEVKDSQWFAYDVEMEPGNGMPCCYQRDGEANGKEGCMVGEVLVLISA